MQTVTFTPHTAVTSALQSSKAGPTNSKSSCRLLIVLIHSICLAERCLVWGVRPGWQWQDGFECPSTTTAWPLPQNKTSWRCISMGQLRGVELHYVHGIVMSLPDATSTSWTWCLCYHPHSNHHPQVLVEVWVWGQFPCLKDHAYGKEFDPHSFYSFILILVLWIMLWASSAKSQCLSWAWYQQSLRLCCMMPHKTRPCTYCRVCALNAGMCCPHCTWLEVAC